MKAQIARWVNTFRHKHASFLFFFFFKEDCVFNTRVRDLITSTITFMFHQQSIYYNVSVISLSLSKKINLKINLTLPSPEKNNFKFQTSTYNFETLTKSLKMFYYIKITSSLKDVNSSKINIKNFSFFLLNFMYNKNNKNTSNSNNKSKKKK